MTTTININGTLTFDESVGLQNTDIAVTGEDNNDNDVLLSTLQTDAATFYDRLFNVAELNLDNTFATISGVGKSADTFITVSSNGALVTSLGFVDGDGGALPVYGSLDPGVATTMQAVDGGSITLFADPVLGDQMILGVDEDGDIVFAAYMDPSGDLTSAKVWIVQFEAIENPDSTDPDDPVDLFDSLGVAATTELLFNFDDLPSGQNLFGIVGDTSSGIVVIGKHPVVDADHEFTNASDTINTSKGGGSVTIGVNNQMFDPSEGAYFTYIKDPDPNYLSGVPGGLDQNEADDADNILYTGGTIEASSASLYISQTQGNSLVTMRLTAFDMADSPQGIDFMNALGTGTVINITGVRVYDENGVLIEDTNDLATYDDPTVSVDLSGSTAVVSGLNSGYKVAWDTESPHDQVLVDGIVGKFDIGGIGLTESGSSRVDIGDKLIFEDSGPSASIGTTGTTVTHDETPGVDGDADDTTDAAVVALFAGVLNTSSDLSTAGYAQSATPVVTSTGSSFGVDGAGTTVFSLEISAPGVDSGLDTTDGTSIYLYKQGDLVEGRIGGELGEVAFAVAIDSATGVVSLAQYASIYHPDDTDPDDSVSVNVSALQAVVTITDDDNDPASQSINIGVEVRFQDDGPTAAISLTGTAVAHDETAGIDGDADDTTDAAVAALFAGVLNTSSDLSTTGYAQSAAAVVSSTGSDYGEDEESGSTAFSLAVSVQGVDSGLDTTDGTSIYLYKQGDLVEGRIGGELGAVAFAIAIDSSTGVVSLAQYASLYHPDDTDPDDSVSIANTALQAVVTVIDGDDDEATNSVNIGAKVQFQDDGPTAAISLTGTAVAHDETAGVDGDADDTTDAAVAALFAGVLNTSSDLSTTGYAQSAAAVVSSTGSDYGEDEESGSTAFSLAVSVQGVDSGLDTTDGTSIYLYKQGDLVEGRIGGELGAVAFAIAIDSATGVVSLAQYASLYHPDDTDPDDSVSIANTALQAVVTVIDGDDDEATNTVNIGAKVQFQDDGPTAAISLAGPAVAHDETAGVDGDADDTTDAAVAALFAGVLNTSSDLGTTGYAQGAAAVVSSTGSDYGEDEESGSTAFSLAVSVQGVDSGLDTTDGTSIYLYKQGDLVEGRIGGELGEVAFAVAIDSATGVVSLAQYASIYHPDDTDPDDSVSIANTALQAVVTVIDGDDDEATNSVNIGAKVQFQDDGPTAAISLAGPAVAHDETAGVDGDADDTTDAAVAALFAGVLNTSSDLGTTGYAQSAAAVVSSTGSDYGEDEESGSTAFSLAVSVQGVDSGLDTTDGTSIYLYKQGDLVEGRIGGELGAVAFAIAIDSSTGVVSLAQYASLYHPDDTDPDDSVSIANTALQAVVTVIDGDDDEATNSVNIGAKVQFQDDGPAIGPISDGLVDYMAGDSVSNPLLAVEGQDDPASVTITAYTNHPTLSEDLSLDGKTVTYFVDADATPGLSAGDTVFFTLELDDSDADAANWDYTFTVHQDPPPAFLEFNFDDLPSGQNLFGVVGDTDDALIVIGKNPDLDGDNEFTNQSDTINTSQGGGTVTIGVNNQMFDPGEGAYFTFVQDPVPNYLSGVTGGLDQNEADDADNIQYTGGTLENMSAYLSISQVQGNTLGTLKLTAYDLADAPQGVDFVNDLGTGTVVNITAVRVYDENGMLVEDTGDLGTYNDPSIAVDLSGDTAVVSGLNAGYRVEWDTAALSDQVLVEDVAGKFDIGGFGMLTPQPTPDQVFEFTVQIEDFDGDTQSDTFKIGVDGTGIYDDNHVDGVTA